MKSDKPGTRRIPLGLNLGIRARDGSPLEGRYSPKPPARLEHDAQAN